MSRPSSDEELVCVSSPLCSPRLPLSPYTPCTPEPELYPLEEENTSYWSPDEIVELESSSDEEPPHPKKFITDYFTFKQMKQGNFPNFLKRFEPAPAKCGQENHRQDAIGNVQEPSWQQLYSKNYEENSSTSRSAVYKSYTLSKKLEVLVYVKANSETKAAEHFKIPRTTISSWRGLDLVPNSQAKRGKGSTWQRGPVDSYHIQKRLTRTFCVGYYKGEICKCRFNGKAYASMQNLLFYRITHSLQPQQGGCRSS